MEKIEYLYHGSQYLFDKLEPQQAFGLESEDGNKFGIYAYEYFEWVIPFALPIRWYPDNPNGGRRSFSCKHGIVTINYGSINPNGFGYVYKMKPENFVKIDKEQWLSKIGIKPLEIIKINVSDYWDKIFFTENALKMIEEIYPMYKRYISKKDNLFYLDINK